MARREVDTSTADAIYAVFQSPNVMDSNCEIANVVDVIYSMACAVRGVGKAITPPNALDGMDAAGGSVSSLTEAVMGNTAGMMAIAEALNNVANAIQRSKGGDA